ncbi:YceI family protein [Ferruginibacter sp. HRS2-29]|uniref:YceI family protein n=1 Tax=Ferruginibacter sp. HRS2-29 TaxID=2487334 RepID=UPI0020CFCFC8|nr:YceI family protein [Ferruginibacter sp. HRS2-29]MCP9749797.1 polyisoprenoid-binding protein [Ferruginibacter sp. HRS2-29]
MSTTKWVIDPAHSELQFKVKHLVISTVTGSFKTFSGEVVSATDSFEDGKISFNIDVNSIYTNQEQRDEHLKGTDFFDAAAFPQISFESTSFAKAGGDEYKLAGNLTMKGVTKPVELDVEFGGSEKDNYGNIKYGFEVTGKVNRKEFGLTYNALTDAGGLALGEDIKVIANIQLVKEA